MGEDTNQIAQAIRAERRDLGRNIEELQRHAKALTDWRTHYRRHTGPALAAAFGGGLILGVMAQGSRANRKGAASAIAPVTKPRGLNNLTLAVGPRARRQMTDTWDALLEALIGVASSKAAALISDVVPGFRDEYRARAEPPHHGDAFRPRAVP